MVVDRSAMDVPFGVGWWCGAVRAWLWRRVGWWWRGGAGVAGGGGGGGGGGGPVAPPLAGGPRGGGVGGRDEGPFALAFDEGPAVVRFLAVVVSAQPVEQVEGGEVGFGVVV